MVGDKRKKKRTVAYLGHSTQNCHIQNTNAWYLYDTNLYDYYVKCFSCKFYNK